jgi:hypothetical protein
MKSITLPPELISLVHYIELNKVGWWEKALRQLILAAIWLSGDTLSAQEVLEYYQKQFKVSLDPAKLRSQIDLLCSSNLIILFPDQRLKISESALREFEKKLKEAEEIESKSKNRFLEVLSHCCPLLDPEATWQEANTQLILPMVQMMGARTYGLLSGSKVDLDRDVTFHQYLDRYPPEIRKSLQIAITTFLNPKDAVVRSYILNYLNSFFFLSAGNLKEDALLTITRLSNIKPTFFIFVDTNFLFSVLELHENPSNEAALMLQELVKQLSGQVTAKLYVLPSTIEEAKRVLIAYRQNMRQLRLTGNLTEATLDIGLSGIVKKYFEEVKKSNSSINADLYFDPYIKDLISIMKTKNVELFNEKTDRYRTDQRVIDDILAQMDFEKTRQGQVAKTYEQWEHDMVLWHFVQDKRLAPLESPLEAVYWVVTVDFRFLGFDAYKISKLNEPVQVCLHPYTLVQMLQFWIPRTAQFEEAMLSSMRLPFLFQEFDPNSERVTIRIIEALGRFENVGDLSKETIAAILMKDALRQKLSVESDISKRVELVKEALIEEHHKIQGKLKEAMGKAERLEKQVHEKDDEIKRMSEQIETQGKKLTDTERQLEKERADRERLENRVSQIEVNNQARKEKELRRRTIAHFAMIWFLLPIVLIGLAGIIIPQYFLRATRLGFWGSAVGIWSFLLIIWVWVTDRKGLKAQATKDWPLFNAFHKFKRWLFWILGAVFLGVFINALWELIKRALNLSKF